MDAFTLQLLEKMQSTPQQFKRKEYSDNYLRCMKPTEAPYQMCVDNALSFGPRPQRGH